MFKEYYGLKSDPFRLSPDHDFCYRYPSFAKGRAYMQYALQAAEGFVVVTGAPGMGKTTLINDLLSDYGPRDYTVATLVNTMLEANEVLRATAYEFGVNVETMDTATVLQRLKQLFIQAHRDGRPPLLVVDEAQNLTLAALEELRMLTNLQLEGKPLLQIFLVGQEELRAKLQDPSLEQLRQRVTAAAHLHPLNQDQVASYIIHRLKVVGWNDFPRLKASLLPVIDAACEGVPRRINQFCSRLLLHGAVEQKSILNAEDAKLVFAELSDERLSRVPIDMSNNITSEFLGSTDGRTAGRPEDERELHEDPAEAESQKKSVMPPPRTREVPEHPRVMMPPLTLPPVTPQTRQGVGRESRPGSIHDAFDNNLVPGLEETYSGYAQKVAKQEQRTTGESISAQHPGTPRPITPLLHYRSRRQPLVAIVLLLFVMAGLGAYGWYQLNLDTARHLLGLEIDSYLSAHANHAVDSDKAPVSAEEVSNTPSHENPAATGTAPDPAVTSVLKD